MKKPSLFLRLVGAVSALVGSRAVWLTLPPILQHPFDLAYIEASKPAMTLVAAGLGTLLLLGLGLDRLQVPARWATVCVSPCVAVALTGLAQLM